MDPQNEERKAVKEARSAFFRAKAKADELRAEYRQKWGAILDEWKRQQVALDAEYKERMDTAESAEKAAEAEFKAAIREKNLARTEAQNG